MTRNQGLTPNQQLDAFRRFLKESHDHIALTYLAQQKIYQETLQKFIDDTLRVLRNEPGSPRDASQE